MSTSYSSRACAKLVCLLSTLLSLSDRKSKSSHRPTSSNSPILTCNKPSSTRSTTKPANNNPPIRFESMCSMCFLDNNKLKTCSRCLTRMLSMLAVDDTNSNKCSMCVDIKIGGSSCSRMKESACWFSSVVSFRLNDFHLANLCLFIFVASLVFLYKFQPLYE